MGRAHMVKKRGPCWSPFVNRFLNKVSCLGRNLKRFHHCHFLESGVKLSTVLIIVSALKLHSFIKNSPLFRPDKIGTQDAPLGGNTFFKIVISLLPLYDCGGREKKGFSGPFSFPTVAEKSRCC